MERFDLLHTIHKALRHAMLTCLLHFDDEERHLMTRMWTLYEDADLVAVFGRVMAAVGPQEREYVMAHMVDALDPVELDEVRQGMPVAV